MSSDRDIVGDSVVVLVRAMLLLEIEFGLRPAGSDNGDSRAATVGEIWTSGDYPGCPAEGKRGGNTGMSVPRSADVPWTLVLCTITSPK